MKKTGFTYIELIFSMAIIVVLMIASMPLLTRTQKAEYTGYGEYQCIMREENGQPVFFERSRFNTSRFQTAFQRTDECLFSRPLGVTRFDITLVGGGGGGSSAATSTAELRYDVLQSLRGATGGNFDLSGDEVSNPFEEGEMVKLSDLGVIQEGISHWFVPDGLNPLERFRVTSADFIELSDQVTLIPTVGGNSGQSSSFTLNVGSMPFDANGQIRVSECDATSTDEFNPGDSICVARTSSADSQGFWTYIRVPNPELSNTPDSFCWSGDRVNRYCFARGGAAPNVRADESDKVVYEATQNGDECIVVPGEAGVFDTRYATELETGRPIDLEGTTCSVGGLTPSTARGIGAGGAGGTYMIQINNGAENKFQFYQTVKLIDLNQRALPQRYARFRIGDVWGNAPATMTAGTVSVSRVTDTGGITADGRGGGGGGGAVFIKW